MMDINCIDLPAEEKDRLSSAFTQQTCLQCKAPLTPYSWTLQNGKVTVQPICTGCGTIYDDIENMKMIGVIAG